MAQIETWLKTDLQQIVRVQELDGNLFTADNGANRIGVIVTNKGESVSLSGGVTGYIIRPDEATVVVNGSLSGNRAWVDLPASVYVKTGPFSVVLKNGNTTIGAACGFIRRSMTDTIIDPGHIVPSLAELLAQIEAMRQLSQTVTQQESGRVTAESGRVAAEQDRASAETTRASAETARAAAETARASAESARAQAETARDNAETARASAESARDDAESARASAETARANAESARDDSETARATAETARAAAETSRGQAETARDTAETARASAESARAQAEISRNTAETARASAESARDSAESARIAAETARAGAETTRDDAESARVTAETARANVETARASAESGRATAEAARASAEAARVQAETARDTAETARASAETARAAAETQRVNDFEAMMSAAEAATNDAEDAADMVENITVEANGLAPGSAPTATVTIVDGHLHIVFGSVKGDPGKDFEIRKTFTSIAQMEAYDPETDPSAKKVRENDFAMIDTGSVQDVDTGKLFCYEPDTIDVWRYIGDLSGSQGIKGETGTGIDHVTLNADYTLTVYYDDGTSDTTASIRGATGATPNISIGTVVTLQPNQNAYVQLDQSSTPEAPVFNFGIPQGETGQVENVYGSTVPMSPSDSTKVKEAIDGKLSANQGSANAGKYMKVGDDGTLTPETLDIGSKADKVQNATVNNLAGLDANGNLKDSGKAASDFVASNQGSGNAGKYMKVGDDGTLTPATLDIGSKADKVQNATDNNFAGLDANGNLKDSGKAASDFVASNQGSGNAGKYMKVGDDGNLTPETLDIGSKADKVQNATDNNFAGLDANGNLKDSGKAASDFVAANQGASNVGKALGIDNTGAVVPVPFSGEDFTGATAQTNGTHGYVPAPAAGDHMKVLMGDGTWKPAPGARVVQTELTVTNTSGAYSGTAVNADVTADMKAISLEIANPYIFNDKITVTCGNGTVTLYCPDVTGSSLVKINTIKGATDASTMTSDEYDRLNNAKVDKNQGVANAGKIMCVNSSGMVSLKENEESRLVVKELDDVSNVSGSYTHTTTVQGITGDFKAVAIEASNPLAFRAAVVIETGTNTITLSCDDVVGESEVTVSLLVVGNANPLNSTEFGALDTRIGQLEDLETTDKSDIVSAINENKEGIDALNSNLIQIANVSTINADGEINLLVANYFVLSAYTTTETKALIPYVRVNSTKWALRYLANGDGIYTGNATIAYVKR